MRKVFVISILAAIVMAGALFVNAATIAVSLQTNERLTLEAAVTTNQTPSELEDLREMMPETVEDARRQIHVRYRFLLWTHDGIHIMWGQCGNGIFIGTDDLGNRVWGIYGKQVFAGFYNGSFFWGKYQNGYWTAVDLFHEPRTHGQYRVFPINPPVMAYEDSLLE